MDYKSSTSPLQLVVLVALVTPITGQLCTLCRDGFPVPYPDKPLKIEGVPVRTCGELEFTAGFLGPANGEFCDSIQSIRTLCGCPIPEHACTLCSDGRQVPNPVVELSNYPARDFVFGAPSDVAMTCESMQAILHNHDETDEICPRIRQDVEIDCGCIQAAEPRINSTQPEDEDRRSTTHYPISSPVPSKSISQCSICMGEGEMIYPDKELQLGDLPVHTCSDLAQFAVLLPKDAFECSGIQALGSLCGCPRPTQGSCNLCPNGEAVPKPKHKLNWFEAGYVSNIPSTFETIGDSFTCEMMESTLAAPAAVFESSTELVCFGAQMKSHICGCSPDWRQKILPWSYRSGGLLSLAGSLAVIGNILRKKKRGTTYHQMVLGISVFDSIGSIAYAFATFMAPQEAGLYLARGNEATCQVQAFMIQLASTSMFYNLILSAYFLLVICYNWKEHEFKNKLPAIHAVILMLGFGLAFGGLPFYGVQYSVCYVLPPPAAETWAPVVGLFAAPVSIVVVLITIMTGVICHRVYRQQLASRRWTFQQNMLLTRKVFWQSLWYMMAFYMTMPLLLISYFIPYRSRSDVWLFVVVGFLASSQGFLNSLVYFQRAGSLAQFNVFLKAHEFTSRLSSLLSWTPRNSTMMASDEFRRPVADKPSNCDQDEVSGSEKVSIRERSKGKLESEVDLRASLRAVRRSFRLTEDGVLVIARASASSCQQREHGDDIPKSCADDDNDDDAKIERFQRLMQGSVDLSERNASRNTVQTDDHVSYEQEAPSGRETTTAPAQVPTFGNWLRNGSTSTAHHRRRHRRESGRLNDLDVDDDDNESMFAATREFFFLNFMSGEESDDDNGNDDALDESVPAAQDQRQSASPGVVSQTFCS